MGTKSDNQLKNIMEEIGRDFSAFRKSQGIGKSRRKVKKYPDDLRAVCRKALGMGAPVNDLASAAGISASCLERWWIHSNEKDTMTMERPPIQILQVAEQKKEQSSPLVLSVQGMRIEISREG